MTRTITGNRVAVAAALLYCLAPASRSQELLTNGGFESGFAGWTRADQLGSDGTFHLQSGVVSPVNGFAVPPPPDGVNAAMTDAQAGGSHVLYQDFTVPTGIVSGALSFERYVQNLATDFISPETLDWATAGNQQARVDIVLPTADPFSLAASDVLLNVFRTQPGDPLVSGYSAVTADVTPVLAGRAGQTLRLRFAEVDNNLFLNFGVDRVSLVATPEIPEPGTGALALAGILPLAASVRRRRRPIG